MEDSQAAIDVMTKMSESEQKDAEWLLCQLAHCDGSSKKLAQIKSFRNQIIVAAAGYAVSNGERDNGRT